jgi:hypothetical protein
MAEVLQPGRQVPPPNREIADLDARLDVEARKAARMARIENAIESVAVEVERISEAQRFTARLLTDGPAQPVGAAAQFEAHPIDVGRANG